jgi:hypothetical protein
MRKNWLHTEQPCKRSIYGMFAGHSGMTIVRDGSAALVWESRQCMERTPASRLNFNSIMVGTQRLEDLAAFYAQLIGGPTDMVDDEQGFRAGK